MDDIYNAGRKSPPVVDRFCFIIGIIFPGSIHDRADQLLIKFTPVPQRHGDIVRLAVFQMIKSKISGSLFRDHHIFTGNNSHTLFLHIFHCTSQVNILKRGPFQIDLCSRVHHLGTQGKGIDICDCSKDRIICNVRKLAVLRHRTGNRSHQEFRFMHTRIISTDVTVGSVQRTVQDPYIRIGDRGLHTCLYKLRCRCENDIAALLDRIGDRFFCKFRCQILIAHGRNFLWESLLQMKPSQFMCISPCGSSRCLCIEKSDLKFRCTEWKQAVEQRLFLLVRVKFQVNDIVMFEKFKLFPALCDQGLEFAYCLLAERFITINC